MYYQELTKEHLELIAPMYVAAFNAPPWSDAWTIETTLKRLTQMYNCEGFYGMVAYEDNELVGMVLGNNEYYYNGLQFLIKEFCVDVNRRGQGLGKTILIEFMNRLKDRGIDEVTLLTSRGDATEGFYQKLGFETFESMIMMGKDIR